MTLSTSIRQLRRRAKLLARDQKIPLHSALDRVARDEGFTGWSLLSAQNAVNDPSRQLLQRLSDGDLVLLGGRPGHGKTMLGLQLLVDAVSDGRRGVFFTLEYTRRETEQRIRSLGGDPDRMGDALDVVTSDEICADYIIRHLAGAVRGTVVVVDYLQLLDQQRNKPELSDQMRALQDFARQSGIVFVFLSQIDRSFDAQSKDLPDMRDIRLPNRIDPRLFSKACFLHAGRFRFHAVT